MPHLSIRALAVLGAAVLCLAAGGAASGEPMSAPSPTWGTDGQVLALATSGTTEYIGGNFSHVGPKDGFAAGKFVALDAATGEPHGVLAPISPSANNMFASAPDGSGGWFVGGLSTFVHLRANGTYDPLWQPSWDLTVLALAVHGDTVYAAGDKNGAFFLAGFDTTTGAMKTFDVALNGFARTLAYSSGTLYAGGDFTTVSGTVARNHLASFDLSTGAVTSFDPNVNGEVDDLQVSGSTVYAGGEFSTVNGSTVRHNLAAFASSDGTATRFDPNVGGQVDALALAGSTVLAGGGPFAAVNGSTVRHNLAAFDATTGTATPFDPDVEGGCVCALAVSGGTVYAGGSFATVNGSVARRGLAGFDLSTSQATAFTTTLNNLGVGSGVHTLQVQGTSVYAGGDFGSAGGVARAGVAAIDLTTGSATGFDPKLETPAGSGAAYALSLSRSTLYVGGIFSKVNGMVARENIAAFDTRTGTATPFNPEADQAVFAIESSPTTVYAGGDFTTANGSLTRNHLAAFDPVSGTATGFNPNVDDSVETLALSGSTLYAGGDFSTVNGATTRRDLAAFDTATGAATAFDPNLDGDAYAIAVSGPTVYAGGNFTHVNGPLARNYLAAFSSTTGAATSFDPNMDSWVDAVLPVGSTIYVGGGFSTVGNGAEEREGIAAFDSEGAVTDWQPSFDNAVDSLALGAGSILVGGGFTSVDGQIVSPSLTAFDARPTAPGSISAIAGDGQATVRFVPSSHGADEAAVYTATASPGGAHGSSTGSPILVAGLNNGTTYTFTVTSTNAAGASPASQPSNPVTPTAAPSTTAPSGGGGGGGGGKPADVGVVVTADSATANVGDTVIFRIGVTDTDNGPAPNLHVMITLPSDGTLVQSYADRGPGCTNAGPNTLDCNLDYLSGDSPKANLIIWDKLASAGAMTLSATATFLLPDPNTANNTASATVNRTPAAPPPTTPTPPTPKPVYCVVPNLKGLTIGTARPKSARAHCTLVTRNAHLASRLIGRIAKQTPRAGQRLAKGTRIHVTVNVGARHKARGVGARR
jgi:urease beta subunit